MESTLFALIALGFGLWLWRDSLRAREAAVAICARACDGEGLQFLDQTVALIRIRLSFKRGQPRFRRVYGFEFSRDGSDRYSGTATLLGPYLESLHMGAWSPGPMTPANGVVELPRRH